MKNVLMERLAKSIVAAMHATGLKRLLFISSTGIYGEVPGERYRSVLDPYRDAAAVIEASDLDYTILRPGWFTHDEQVSYQLTQKGRAVRRPRKESHERCHRRRRTRSW